jgi:hypothetical protein
VNVFGSLRPTWRTASSPTGTETTVTVSPAGVTRSSVRMSSTSRGAFAVSVSPARLSSTGSVSGTHSPSGVAATVRRWSPSRTSNNAVSNVNTSLATVNIRS